jgi:hypothetical protein
MTWNLRGADVKVNVGLGEWLERTLRRVGKEKPNKRIFVRKAKRGWLPS